jgi:hypothetical protein
MSNVNAQKTSTPISSTTSAKVKSTDWQLLLSNEFVDVSYRYAECSLPSEGIHNEYAYIQIKNKTSKELKIEWNTEYWYNDKCTGCDAGNKEDHKTVILKSNETLEGNCSKDCQHSLMILSKKLNLNMKTTLTNFNLRDLKATPITK